MLKSEILSVVVFSFFASSQPSRESIDYHPVLRSGSLASAGINGRRSSKKSTYGAGGDWGKGALLVTKDEGERGR